MIKVVTQFGDGDCIASDRNTSECKEILDSTEVWKSLEHENLLKFEFENQKGQPTFILEYFKTDIGKFRETKSSSLSEESWKKIIYQILAAVAYLHLQEVAHGEIRVTFLACSQKNSLKIF
jgi:hypothetical protein